MILPSFMMNMADNVTMSLGGNHSAYTEDLYEYQLGHRLRTILFSPENVIALILGTMGITLNVLSILAISRLCYSQLTSHFRLILNLAISDILIGVSLIMFIIINAFVPLYPVGQGPADKRLVSRCLYMFTRGLNCTGLAITLLNLMGMAIDHYIAIMRPLHYTIMLSRERSICMIATLWVCAILFGFSDFFSAYPKYSHYTDKYNFCEFVHLTKYNEEYAVFVLALACLVIMLFIYIRIYMEVRKHHSRQTSAHSTQQDIVKNKKAIITTLLILGTFILCWLPLCIFSIVLIILVSINPAVVAQNTQVLIKVDSYLFNLLLLNVIADPIIYAARVKEVQFGYRRLCCRRNWKRSRSNSSFDISQYTTFLDMPRKTSRASNTVVFEKHGVNQTSIPMLKPLEVSIILPND